MIKAFYSDDIINKLGAIFTYAINNNYSALSAEDLIINSSFINELENNRYNINLSVVDILKNVFKNNLIDSYELSYLGLFLGESYFKLFINENKSFEYLFLYWPLMEFIPNYSVYHEMDFSNLKSDFELTRNRIPLLKKLAINRGYKLVEISKLTGINLKTINKYGSSDVALFSASYENIYRLAKLFKVKENIFISSLNVFLDDTAYIFDKSFVTYRNYLGLYYADYFDKEVNANNAVFDKNANKFKLDNGLELLVIVDGVNSFNVNKINSVCNGSTYVVFMPVGYYVDETIFKSLNECISKEVLVLTNNFAYLVKKNIRKELTETIHRSLIIKAKLSLENIL